MLKRVMTISVASLAATMAIPLPAAADDGDGGLHRPDLEAGFCPGGYAVPGGDELHCLGQPYPDQSQWLETRVATMFPTRTLPPPPQSKPRFHCVIIPVPSVVVIAPKGGCHRNKRH